MQNGLLETRIKALTVLVVDNDHYMRKIVRGMLAAIGVKNCYQASDAVAGIEAVNNYLPDLILIEWEMPGIDGAQFVRMIRSREHCPVPEVPIIMLSDKGDRWRVLEAAKIGVHEFILRPMSPKTLNDRIVRIVSRPRPTVMCSGYYGPVEAPQ